MSKPTACGVLRQSNLYQEEGDPLDTNVLWVNAYQLLKAGDTVDNVEPNYARADLSQEGMYDPLVKALYCSAAC